jgi:hypothetical protein
VSVSRQSSGCSQGYYCAVSGSSKLLTESILFPKTPSGRSSRRVSFLAEQHRLLKPGKSRPASLGRLRPGSFPKNPRGRVGGRVANKSCWFDLAPGSIFLGAPNLDKEEEAMSPLGAAMCCCAATLMAARYRWPSSRLEQIAHRLFTNSSGCMDGGWLLLTPSRPRSLSAFTIARCENAKAIIPY